MKDVKRYEDMSKGDKKFIFIPPGQLIVSTTSNEEHKDLLKLARNHKGKVIVAGGFTNTGDGYLPINSYASVSLNIGKRDVTPVVDFVKSLPGITENHVEVFKA